MQMKFNDGQSEFSRVFNFAILGYSQNSRKLDACENIVFYSITIAVSMVVNMILVIATCPVYTCCEGIASRWQSDCE